MKYMFLISGGNFNDPDGRLTLLTLDLETSQFSIDFDDRIVHPYPDIALSGKGVTGMFVQDECVWMCFSNTIVMRRLFQSSLEKVISDPNFNDLHQIEPTVDGFLIANTGNESIDRYYYNGEYINRTVFLSDELQLNRPKLSPTEDMKPHLYHISCACLNANSGRIVALCRQKRIMNLDTWTWVGPLMDSLIHDVQLVEDQSLWWTTISGEIWRSVDHSHAERVFDLKEHQSDIGWIRGLAITAEGVLVGTTAIRPSNSGYFHSQAGIEPHDTPSSVTWLPFDPSKQSLSLLMPEAENRKVFSIRCVNQNKKLTHL